VERHWNATNRKWRRTDNSAEVHAMKVSSG
jgi:hypothetical protein